MSRKSKYSGAVLVISRGFSPRTDNIGDGNGRFAQLHNWLALVSAVSMHSDSMITYEEAVSAVQHAAEVNGYVSTCNAHGFIQARIRKGHLATAIPYHTRTQPL